VPDYRGKSRPSGQPDNQGNDVFQFRRGTASRTPSALGFDKNEIIDRSVKIGTYDISILPYEDCCTVFLPDYPAIRPKLKDILEEEKKLDVEALIAEAFSGLEKEEL